MKRRVGYLPDSPIFYDYLRGREIIQFIGEMHGLSAAESKQRTVEQMTDHPPVSMIPVFGLGICAAAAYERTRTLLAPMLAHALYNAVVLAYQSLS